MTIPGEYKFGFVVGRFLQMVADTAGDIDPYPDPRPARGTITFTPHERQRKVSQDFSAFVGHATVGASLGPNGQIIDAEGRDGIWIIEGTHTVRVTNDAGIVVPDFDITVTPEHTIENPLDLVTAAPPQPGPGVTLQTMLVPPGGSPDETLVRDEGGALVWMPVDEIGPKGDSAYATAVAEGFAGTEAEWLASLVGPAPVTSWSGTALVVDGVTGPDLKGPKGDTGAPGALADSSSYILTGPGRPDVPATTGGIITGSEPVGAEFRSTDGAGVGAWVWMKRPDGWGGIGWVVTDGDTGWRRLEGTTEQIPAIYLRRSNAGLHISWPRSQTSNAITDGTTITPALPGTWIPPRIDYGYPLVAAVTAPTAASLVVTSQLMLAIRGSSVPAWLSADIIATPEVASWPTTLPGIPW